MVDVINIDSGQDIQIYNDNFNFKVFAGPGAGKTHFLTYNIKKIIENSRKLKIDSNRKVACITYTNVAVDEIKSRLDVYSKYVYVSTIHSFLNEYIIQPYNEQLKIILQKKYIIIIPKNIKITVRREGFSLLNQEQAVKLLEKISEKDPILYKKLSIYAKKVSFFDNFKINLNNIDFENENLNIQYGNVNNFNKKEIETIKNKMLEVCGVLDYNDILLFSYILIKNFKLIQYSIRYLFPYLLIDEYQDTTQIQNAIVQIFAASKTVSVGVVGDCAQAIYGFAGSNYNDFLQLEMSAKEMRIYKIEGNRRSKQNIVHFLNYIRQNDSYINKQYCVGENKDGGKVIFLLNENNTLDVWNYIPSNTISICRRWTDTFLTVPDIPKDELFALENIYNINRFALGNDMTSMFVDDIPGWVAQIKFISNIKDKINSKNFISIIKECEKIFDLSALNKTVGNQTKTYCEINKFIQKMRNINENENYFNICNYINESAQRIDLPIVKYFEVHDENNDKEEGIIVELLRYLNVLSYSTLRKISKEIFVEDSKHVTIHRVKGKEYQNVLVKYETADFLNDELYDLLKEPELFNDLGKREFPRNSENPRVAYVGFSRAIEGLYVQVRATAKEFEIVEEKFNKYMKENNIIEKFYQVIDLNN